MSSSAAAPKSDLYSLGAMLYEMVTGPGYSHCCFTAHSDLDAETSKKVTDAFLSASLSTEEESRSGTESRSIADEPHPWFDTSGTVALEHFESSEAAHKDHRRN